MKFKVFFSKKKRTPSEKNSNLQVAKANLVAQIMISTIVIATLISPLAFYPTSLYIYPVSIRYSDGYINHHDIKLKSIHSMEIEGSPKLGYNTLKVTWSISSDCGPPIKIIQYQLFRKGIYIWIWGFKGPCPQVVGSLKYEIGIFIPFPGVWTIYCNGRPLAILV
jgi:hypothetical protein